jgi:hypothetical protein
MLQFFFSINLHYNNMTNKLERKLFPTRKKLRKLKNNNTLLHYTQT